MELPRGFKRLLLLGSFLSLPSLLPAQAAPVPVTAPTVAMRPAVHSVRYYFISCVPYARQRSGISLPGNAWQWWGNAAGHYARGQAPSPGAILVFRPIRRMPLGHVAVVSRIINSREILVDQANWIPAGQIRLGVPVVDVSPENDWTEVRVSNGGGHFGSDYPTYGFIYRTPPGRFPTVVAESLPLPPMSPADIKAAGLTGMPVGTAATRIEVAEAPYVAPGGSALVSGGLQLDGPDHSLR